MSREIDQRVVEMRFDNKQFEQESKKTLNTLERLKEALGFTKSTKALENLDKTVKDIKLDGIASGVAALEQRFSTMGIVGMRVIENITDGLTNSLGRAVNFVTDSIVSGGVKRAMNIENAHFQLQALLKDEEKVQAVMADAMESVDGTAYAYDEAAKAASQFAASGLESGEEMLGALKGITGVAAMTNSAYEDISRVFTTVAGNGRLMGDQLLQLSSRGLNTASTLAEYFKEVRGQANMTEAEIRSMVSDGQISFRDFSDAMTWAFGDSAKRANETFTGAMSNMKSALARIGADFISPLVEQNGEMVQLFNALRIKINDVKSALTFDEQRSAISGLAEATSIPLSRLNQMFSDIKTNGKVMADDFKVLSNRGINAEQVMAKYINGVVDGSIRASYATKTSLEALTNGIKVSTIQIRQFLEEGKIDLATFTGAMETEFGNEKTLVKQFTDFFLDHLHSVVEAINSTDMTEPMEVFYYGFESIKNVVNGLLSVLRPVADAFGDVFLSFGMDDVLSLSSAIEQMTEKLKLSEKGSENLHDAFQGLFSVVKLGIDIFFKLISVIVPINKPVTEIGDGFLDLVGAIGRALTSITEAIESCYLLNLAFDVLETGFSTSMGALAKTIRTIKDFIVAVKGLSGTKKLIDSINNAFQKLGDKASPYIKSFIDGMEKMFSSLFKIDNLNTDDVLETLSRAFEGLAVAIDTFDLSTFKISFDPLKNKLQDLYELLMSNEGIAAFVTNFKDFTKELEEAFAMDNVLDRMEKIMDIFGKFFNWVKENFRPSFEGFNAGGVLAFGGMAALIYTLNNGLKTLNKMLSDSNPIINIFGNLNKTLTAYQKDLRADALIKIAGAIAILAGAIVLLSFADMDRAWQATIMLGLIGAGLATSVGYLMNAINKGKTANDALYQFSKGLKKSMTNLTKAVKYKAIGSAFKNFGQSIAYIAGSIIALGIMYRKDPEALYAASEMVAVIAGVMVGIMYTMTKLGEKSQMGMKNFSKASFGVLALSLALSMIISALNKIMKMEFPYDWAEKFLVLSLLLGELAALALVLGVSTRIAGNKKMNSAPFIGLAAMLLVTVKSLEMLFKMDLPDDWAKKVFILSGIFVALSGLMIVVAAASRLAGGQMKATGTILAMAGFVAVVAGSLMILSILPIDKMMAGAGALGVVLMGLAVAMVGASTVTSAHTSKTVMSMAIMVGVIAAALGVLSLIPTDQLVASAAALGTVLMGLALDFLAVSKVGGLKSLIPILGMVGVIALIVYELVKLTDYPWENLLASAASISIVLVAVSAALGITSKLKVDPGTAAMSAVSIVAFIGVLGALFYALASLWDWLGGKEEVLDKGIELSIKVAEGLGRLIGAFIGGVADGIMSVLPAIGESLSGFWENSSEFFDGMSGIGDDTLAKISKLAAVLVVFGAVDIIEAITKLMGSGIDKFGTKLSKFMSNSTLFFAVLSTIEPETMEAGKSLAKMILALTTADLLNGVAKFIGASGNLSTFGAELGTFGTSLVDFANSVSGLESTDKVEAAAEVATTMAKIAGSLTKHGGVLQVFTGDNNLASFGVELSLFADKIVNFSRKISNINDAGIEKANAAAEITTSMIEVSKTLKNHSGVLQFFTGDNNLADFGQEMVMFGSAVVRFANIVDDVNPNAVNGAVTIGNIMTELANKIPNSAGIIGGLFTGDNNIAGFGEDLVSFGESIKGFVDNVKGLNSGSVTGVKAITEIMTTLADKLPENGGVVGWWKGGNKSLDTFGEELKAFGGYFKEFYESISEINANKVNDVLGTFSFLGEFAKIASESGITTASEFTIAFTQLATYGVDAFKKPFEDSKDSITESIEKMIKYAVMEIQNQSDKFDDSGEKSVNAYVKGIKDKGDDAEKAGSYLVDRTTSKIYLVSDDFYDAGVNAVAGFVKGIRSKIADAEDIGEALGNAAYEAAKKALDEHSPSKKMGRVGTFAGIGYVRALMVYVAKAAEAGKEMGESTLNGISKVVDGSKYSNLFQDPVIHPTVDLKSVRRSAADIQNMFKSAIRVSSGIGSSVSSSFKAKKEGSELADAIDKLRKAETKKYGDTYILEGITYKEGDDVSNAIGSLIRAANIRKRV